MFEMVDERLNDWVDKSAMECGRGCGGTLELVRRDYLFSGPGGKRVLVEDAELLECPVCGDLTVPSRTAELVAEYFQGELEPDEVSEIPTFKAKSA